ncbi:MAG: hypothetical protein U9R44_06495 [Candidatus Omnitrophota bacterium]|nr:hypothetical protein [Candidatus Omnitrophota bacterium]
MSALTEEEINQIYYQLDLYRELIEYLDEVFQDFSYGYLEPGPALKKINVITHQYNRTAGSVPEEAERMHELTKQLLSRVEYYFIFYKSNYRENPEINRKILETRYELAREAEKLLNMYGY